jgi:RND family efflux transporter MFP subunit
MKKLLLIGLIGLGLLTTACGAEEPVEETAPPETPVEVTRPTAENLAERFRFYGELTYENPVTIFPQISGPGAVKALHFSEGDYVEEGEVIAELDGEKLLDSIESARAAYETALKNFENTSENLALAKENYEKNLALYEAGSISQAQLDNAALQASDTKLSLARSQLNQARVQYDNALAMKEDLVIKAPISGQILRMTLTESSLATSQHQITFVDTQDLIVKIFVTENILPTLNLTDPVEIDFPAVELETSGRVRRVTDLADPQTGLYPVQIALNSIPSGLKTGMNARVTLYTNRKQDALLIPIDALLSDEEGPFVYVVRDDLAEKVRVATRMDDGEVIEVTSGLQMEDLVITKGQNFIDAGERVAIVRGADR